MILMDALVDRQLSLLVCHRCRCIENDFPWWMQQIHFCFSQYIEYVLTLPFEFITWKIVHLWFVSPLFFPSQAGKFNAFWAAVVSWIQMVSNCHLRISKTVVQLLDYGLSEKMLAVDLRQLKINQEIIIGLCMSEWNNFLKSPMRIFTIIPITPMMEMSYNQVILSFFFLFSPPILMCRVYFDQ